MPEKETRIMKKILIAAVTVLTLGAGLAVAGTEGGFGYHHHGRHGVFGEKLAAKLNLTDAQKAQVKDIKKSSHEQNAAFFKSAHQTFKEFKAAKKANDTAKMDALKATMESNRAQMKQIREAEKAKIASVLTPEQNAQWQKLQAERAARRGNKS
jgi:periplasmic protein CpxP/Spy